MVNFIRALLKNRGSSKQFFPKVEKIKVVVIDFVEYSNRNYADALCCMLRNSKYFEVTHFKENFDKSFLSLQGRHFFDFADAGNKILQKLYADVVVWGYQENEYLRLNFQTANTYSDWNHISCSMLDSLYIPINIFNKLNVFDDIYTSLIYGNIAIAISEQRIDLRNLKNDILTGIVNKFNTSGPIANNEIISSAYILNILGLIYLVHHQKNLNKQSLTIIKNLFYNALSLQKQSQQYIHTGCLYKNTAQLFELAINSELPNHQLLFKEAISNYRLAHKYLDYYNYPYDFGLISFKLSQLYFKYWKFSNDTQALRDAVFYLREAEKTYTQIAFPEAWAKIEEYLGFYLSLLGLFSKNNEISQIAIKSYKNKQLIYRKELYPVAWAKTQENIGNVYYNIGKNSNDKTAFNEAIKYYKSALEIYNKKQLQKEITIINSSIEKVQRISY